MTGLSPQDRWLAFDIGGANIKAAHAEGPAGSIPFELWKRPEDLPGVLRVLAATFPEFDRVALTMTAELCDCFATKAEGVQAVVQAVLSLTTADRLAIWGTDGQFHTVAGIEAQPALAAASNWLALAEVAARLVPQGPGLLIDIGTTTTDLIPLRDGHAVPRGRTDTQRLQAGELEYVGTRRTPVCAIAAALEYRGGPVSLAAELFATTLDVYLTLGEIPPDPTDDATADGRPATVEAAHDRLARMVCADRTEFSAGDAQALARSAHQALLRRLRAAVERGMAALGPPRAVVLAGTGSFLARALAQEVLQPGDPIYGLAELWGGDASGAGCAHALVQLAVERLAGDRA